MAQVICTLPNASELISGVKFSKNGKVGMISEEVTDDEAAEFAKISGYKIVAAKAPAKAGAAAETTGAGEGQGAGTGAAGNT